jgi:hypothetical protein
MWKHPKASMIKFHLHTDELFILKQQPRYHQHGGRIGSQVILGV